MNEHIGFEELVAFAWMDELSTESIRLAARINGHLLACTECMERLDSLKAIRRSADALKQSRRQRSAKIIRVDFAASDVAEFRAADFSTPAIIDEGFVDAFDDENSEN